MALLSACNGADTVAVSEPHFSLSADAIDLTGSAGQTIPARVIVTDANGRPGANVRVEWSARSGSVASASSLTDASGLAAIEWTLGGAIGTQELEARVAGAAPFVHRAGVRAGDAARVIPVAASLQLSLLGDSARVDAQVVDRFGNPTGAAPAMAIESGPDVIALIPGTRTVVARDRGVAVVRLSADTASALLTVIVSPSSPRPMKVVGDTIRPGVPFVIEGDAFALTPAKVEVHVSGVRATVTAVSRTHIEALIPNGSIPCQATAFAQVRVTIASGVGETQAPLRVARRLDLRRGESTSLLTADEARCAELGAPAGGARARYVVAVINTSVAASATSGFELRGVGAGAMTGTAAVNLAPAAAAVAAERTTAKAVGGAKRSAGAAASGTAPASLAAALQQFRRQDDDHGDQLERDRALVQRVGSPAGAWRTRAASRVGVAADRAPRGVGDIVTMKALYNSCTIGRDIQARVVYAGTRAVVLEDVAAPRAGTMDAEYRAIGEEFDAVHYPLLTANIGDPLAMNGVMEGDARVTMLFTRYVNDSLPGIAGYVTACNFYPKSTFAASNEDEVFYARVANAAEVPAEWRRSMRSTVLHEAKHLASYAERLSRSYPFEETWLEESTARIAEELYSRRFSGGGAWKGNAGYASTVRCELVACDDRPIMMWKHFSSLHAYYRGVDTLTPIGASAAGDYTFYASGWSLVRWAADHYAANEGQWLRDLVRGGPQTGLTNLALRTGRPSAEMLADWALATAVDDLAGFAPERPQLALPSWNTADQMRGLAGAYPGMFSEAPLSMRHYSFGQFTLPVGKLRSYSTSYFSFEGNQAGSQLIELRGAGGAAGPGMLRLAVVRVE